MGFFTAFVKRCNNTFLFSVISAQTMLKTLPVVFLRRSKI